MQIKEFLQVHGYTDSVVVINGANHPTAPWKQSVASVASVAWMGGLALNFFGETVFSTLGIKEKPAFYNYLKENPMGTLGGLFLMNNMAHGLLTTGAFEAYLNGEEIFSKLKEGRVPSGEELISALKFHGVKPAR